MKNSVRIFFYCLLATIVTAGNSFYAHAQDPCPTNFDGSTLATAKRNIQAWDNKIVAFDIEVVDVQKGYQGAPYFLGRLDNGKTIWIGTLVVTGAIKKGASLRVLGYFKPLMQNDDMADINKEGYHVMAIAVKDNNTGTVGIWPRENARVQTWFDGSIPE